MAAGDTGEADTSSGRASASTPIRVAILGSGRVAGSLARALDAVPDVAMLGVGGRDPVRSGECARRAGVPVLGAEDPAHDGRPPADTVPTLPAAPAVDLLVVAVADTAVAEVAAQAADLLARAGRMPGSVVHVSGATGLAPLAPFARFGVEVGAWHPLQAFPAAETPPAAGITWTITTSADPVDGEGSPGLLAPVLTRLTEALGGRARPLAAEHRIAYHAAAVLASNHPAALVAQAVDVLVGCGFTRADALDAVLPLLRSSIDALESAGLPAGVTGPVVRGDVTTVAAHLDALEGRTRALYAEATRALVPLAADRGLDPERVRALEDLLTDGAPEGR